MTVYPWFPNDAVLVVRLASGHRAVWSGARWNRRVRAIAKGSLADLPELIEQCPPLLARVECT